MHQMQCESLECMHVVNLAMTRRICTSRGNLPYYSMCVPRLLTLRILHPPVPPLPTTLTHLAPTTFNALASYLQLHRPDRQP